MDTGVFIFTDREAAVAILQDQLVSRGVGTEPMEHRPAVLVAIYRAAISEQLIVEESRAVIGPRRSGVRNPRDAFGKINPRDLV